MGIGRPATYAVAVDGLEKKGYVTTEKRQLVPTPLAEKIYDALIGKFLFINVDFTRNLEQDLDAITEGRATYSTVVHNMHNLLKTELAALGVAANPVRRAPAAPAIDAAGKVMKCPKCGKNMVERSGPRGKFFGCTGWPKCNGTRQITT